MESLENWIGIDYGSKLAGTTAITWYDQNREMITTAISKKKQDADLFIKDHIHQLQPSRVFIDAPLSLPSAYFGKGENYFYRECDTETQAMSPMFIGGLTARAIKLDKSFSGIQFLEAYPSGLINHLNLKPYGYKKGTVTAEFKGELEKNTPYQIDSLVWGNWHSVDSLLAWIIGLRFSQGQSKMIGNLEEGVIYI